MFIARLLLIATDTVPHMHAKAAKPRNVAAIVSDSTARPASNPNPRPEMRPANAARAWRCNWRSNGRCRAGSSSFRSALRHLLGMTARFVAWQPLERDPPGNGRGHPPFLTPRGLLPRRRPRDRRGGSTD